jgi:hypothetical protein
MTTLNPRFPCLSPESADPAAIPLHLRIEEIARELDHRRAIYPRRVDKGRMTSQDADRGIDAFAAIAADLRVEALWTVWGATQPGTAADVDARRAYRHAHDQAAPLLAAFTWSQLVGALRREIALRRKFYPQWVASGTLGKADARHRLERIEAVHFQWWRWGHNIMPDELGPCQREPLKTPLTGASLDAWKATVRAHRTLFDPAGKRGEYAHAGASEPPALPEPELAFA